MGALYEFINVRHHYDLERPSLDNLCFSIKEHTKTAIVGGNGAGKSTILFHLNGLFTPDSGRVAFKGQVIDKKLAKKLVRVAGVVFQDPDDQLISLEVKEDIAFGPIQLGVGKAEADRRAEKYMNLLNIAHLARRNPNELSYGQKKQVAIAGILAMETEVFIIDEPMAFLDPEGKKRILEVLELLAEKGKHLIVTTHDMQFVAQWAEEVVVIHEGSCLGVYSPRELYQNKQVMEKASLDLPPVAELFDGLWEEEWGEMPISAEEAKAWLRKMRK
jgi:cobalt/nickel transport system ATP-binding protein